MSRISSNLQRLKLQRLIVALIIGLVPLWSVNAYAKPAGLVGDTAPDFALRSLTGANLRLSEYRSEVVVLNFWADWCGKCGTAMSVLDELNQQYDAAGMKVIVVNVTGEAAAARDLAQSLNLNFPILLDSGQQVSRLYDLRQLPMTLLIDREGVVQFVQQGFKGDAARKLKQAVAARMAQQAM